MSRLSQDAIELAARMAAEKAREYFGLDPKWTIRIIVTDLDDAGCMGRAQVNAEYFSATIEISDRHDDLEKVWGTAGHEVAHIALAHWHEYAAIADLEGEELFPPAFRIPLEKTTVLLEWLFTQAHPYPTAD